MEKYFGVCYYPELYPKEKQEAFIREDIENMRRARFNVVRMAEFCWCLMEPREGVYDFDWLEEIVDRLGQNGIYTVLCTPTVSPFGWPAGILKHCMWTIWACSAATAGGTITATIRPFSGTLRKKSVWK